MNHDVSPVRPDSTELTAPDFTTFMRCYQDMVYSTAVRVVGNAAQAEDISQEVFIRAHSRFEDLGRSPTAGGWLKTVAMNLSINHVQRYRKRWSFFSELGRSRDGEAEDRPVEFADEWQDPLLSSAAEERRARVDQALEQLPAHQRVPLVLAVPSALPRAGFWLRMLALAIDALIVLVVSSAFYAQPKLSLVLLAGYGAVMWRFRGTTIGGIVFGIKVVRLDDRPVDWPTAIVRALASFLSLFAAGLGFLWIIWDPERQAWHDKIAGTVVVRVPRGVSLV